MVSEYGRVGSRYEQDQEMATVNCTGRYTCVVGVAVNIIL
jgi:hypothetical protein